MTNIEFSNEFDILYNSVTSNLAPGLDEYEKSVFLTKGQDEIVKSYFNPRSNKTQEGFDGNEKRQIDFSMIMRSHTYEGVNNIEVVEDTNLTNGLKDCTSYSQMLELFKDNGSLMTTADVGYINLYMSSIASVFTEGDEEQTFATVAPFAASFFDGRTNTKSIALDDDILMFVNEYVEVAKDTTERARLTVIPIRYDEYSRLMLKPYKRPLKSQAWRLLEGNKAEIIIGPNDTLTKYSIRYVKRPRPIILTNLGELSINGNHGEDQDGSATSCELDPILHPEILQRAVELAKAAYMGDLNSQLALGLLSQTDLGIIQSSR